MTGILRMGEREKRREREKERERKGERADTYSFTNYKDLKGKATTPTDDLIPPVRDDKSTVVITLFYLSPYKMFSNMSMLTNWKIG